MRGLWCEAVLGLVIGCAALWLGGCRSGTQGAGSGQTDAQKGPARGAAMGQPTRGSAAMEKPSRRGLEPLICLWQHRQEVDIAPLVKQLGFNTVWTSDEPYHGQAWEQTHMYRALQVPGIRYVLAKIERIQWGQTHEGSVKHAQWIGELSRKYQEIIGLYLNDFYDEVEEGYRTMEQWREIIAAAKAANRDLAIWVPHYPHRANEQRAYDVDYQGVIFNLWDPRNLEGAEGYLAQAEEQHAGKTILAGLYLNSGARRGQWLSEQEFKGLLKLYVDHLNAGKLDGVRVFCACQLIERPEYVRWTEEVMQGLKRPGGSY